MNCYVCHAPGDQGANVCARHRPRARRALATCDAAFVAIRDHIEFGELPRGYVSPDEMERLRMAKWEAEAGDDAIAAERAAYAFNRAFAHNARIANGARS